MIPTRIVDLSQPVFNNCPQYPDVNPRPVQVRHMYVLGVAPVNKEIVELTTHSGTHCDAPFHFFADGARIDEVSLESYVGRATILDLRGKAPGSSIGEDDVRPYASRIREGDVVLLNTGWGYRRANTAEFLIDYVWCDGDAARLIVERGAKGVGIDAVSLGGYGDPSKAAPAHRAILGAGKFVVEDLYFPDEVMDGRERLFVAAPVKVRGCSAAWARAALWEF